MSQKINVATVTMDRNWKRTYLPQHLSLLSRGLSWSPGTSSDVVTLAIRVDLVIITAAKLFCCSLLHHLRLHRYLCVLAEVPGRVVLLWTRAFRDVEAVMQHDPCSVMRSLFVRVTNANKRPTNADRRRRPHATRMDDRRDYVLKVHKSTASHFHTNFSQIISIFHSTQYLHFLL